MQVTTERAPRTVKAAANGANAPDEPLYGHPLMCASLPTQHFPQGSVPARVAHQLIKDELALDGNPKMNVRIVLVCYSGVMVVFRWRDSDYCTWCYASDSWRHL